MVTGPMRRSNLYPPDWDKISARVIEERGNTCERCHKSPPEVHWLTTHHLDGNPANNPEDGSNWFVCCPKCHFYIDRYVYPRRPVPLGEDGVQTKMVI